MIENIIYVLLALLGLGFLVFIHELGHYFIAKKTGMVVEVFSIGFGTPVYSWMRGDVKWQIGALPFGGYVKIAGMEKKGNLEPYEIKDGFFGKKPIDRIKVAFAGPVVNILFAFLAFSLIWAFGGREKKFNEYTKKIGSIDRSSELYKNEVRTGDEINCLGRRAYNGLNDLMYVSVLDEKTCNIKGLKIDYFSGSKSSFEYDLDTYKVPSSLGGNIYSIGVEIPASFLIYSQNDRKIFDSPMKDSGIKDGDRFLWANGEIIFSVKQLSALLNENSTFLTIERKGEYFQAKIKKVKIEDINLNKFDKEEIDDWRYESDIQTKLSDLYFLPYYFNENGVVESRLDFIDENLAKSLFDIDPRNSFSKVLERGDRIVAVDGLGVSSAYDILKVLQTPHAVIIVQRGHGSIKNISWKEADSYFDKSLNAQKLFEMASHIGTVQQKSNIEDLYLLNTVNPITLEELYIRMGEKEALKQEISSSEKKINKIDNPETRSEALNELENAKKELKLGVAFKDMNVKYNPNPISLFYLSLSDIWKTLSSLFTGNLSPKWMSGPVGIVQVIHHSWSLGFSEALFWLGVISLNLGIINLFPLPVLDGGHIVFSLVEMVTKKPIKAKTMEKLIIPFVVLLIGAIIFFTYNDIIRLIKNFF